MSKQPRMPRPKFSTRLRKITNNLSIAFALLSTLNLATYAVSINFSIANPTGFLFSLYALANTIIYGLIALKVRSY